MIAIYLWILLFVFVGADQPISCQKCRNQRVHNMKGADCYDLGLREIPQCLNPNIEVLDLSYNRIRKVKETDIERYSSLKYLYLTDNTITEIEEKALSKLTSLELLHLSYNPLLAIPKTIFQLPSLKKLYISEHQDVDVAYDIEKGKPILSPLMMLEIAFNDMRELPNLGELPTLIFYNISGNKDVLMKTSHFAGLCMLKQIDMTKFSGRFVSDCDCINIQRWLQARKVEIIGEFICQINDCAYEIPESDLEMFAICLESNKVKSLHSTLLYIVLPACLIATIILCILLFMCWRKTNSRYHRTSVQIHANRPLFK
nr:tsukushin-like [Onthophagus taurus]